MPDATQINGTYSTPALTKTQCANFTVNTGSTKDYLANVYGDVGGKKVALNIEFDPDGEGYTNPGTSVDPESNSMSYDHASLQLPGEYEARADVVGPSGPMQSLILNPDRRSGHIDAWFGLLGRSTKDEQNVGVIHVVGDWRCG